MTGDVLHIGAAPAGKQVASLDDALKPQLTHAWDIGVLYGPTVRRTSSRPAISTPCSPRTGRCITTPIRRAFG
nr:hypothetical protein [Methyloceanibacter marginalis]